MLVKEMESGSIVTIGRNAKENDRVTFELSEGDDLWFHADEYAGSHVVLHNDSNTFSKGDIQTAANLAAYHSKGRQERTVNVMYTRIKHVRKEKGCGCGEVIVDEYSIIRAHPNAYVQNK
jgi:predicted ribosome quality control (RQC) complex YloA/Tae2 family protein